MSSDFDIIVIGSGLVGSAVGCCLRNLGLKVAVLEREPPLVAATDERPLTLNYASVHVLKALGLWESLSLGATPLSRVKVTQQGCWGHLHFSHRELQVPLLGYVVRYGDLVRVLYDHALQGAQRLCMDRLESIEADADCTQVGYVFRNQLNTVSAKLVIACDGASSVCRDKLGIKVKAGNDDHCAYSMVLSLKRPHDGVAHQRYTEQGCLALLPLFEPDQYRLVWTMSKKRFKEVSTWSGTTLSESIFSIFSGFIPPISQVLNTASYPLSVGAVDNCVRDRVVLMGSAAQRFYPTTAQGFNLSLRDAAALAQCLAESKASGGALDVQGLLNRYQSWRAPNQRRVMAMTQYGYHCFQLRLPLMATLRGMGLAAVDCLPVVKRRLGRQLLGLDGVVPLLALGVPLEECGGNGAV